MHQIHTLVRLLVLLLFTVLCVDGKLNNIRTPIPRNQKSAPTCQQDYYTLEFYYSICIVWWLWMRNRITKFGSINFRTDVDYVWTTCCILLAVLTNTYFPLFILKATCSVLWFSSTRSSRQFQAQTKVLSKSYHHGNRKPRI